MLKVKTIALISVLILAISIVAVSAKEYITGYDVNNNCSPVRVEKGVYVPGVSLYPTCQPSLLGGTTKGNIRTNGNLTVDGNSTLTGNVSIGGHALQAPGSITATTTLTTSSDNIQLLSASANMTTVTLPAATAGAFFRFQVSGALTGSSVVIDSAEGDNISGTLIVAGAVVDCRDEDQINIVTDGEAIGDYVELYSDGTSWFLVDSGVLTSAKMTCTDPS